MAVSEAYRDFGIVGATGGNAGVAGGATARGNTGMAGEAMVVFRWR